MSRAENPVQREIWLGVQDTSRLFRLNTGRAWLSALGPNGVKRLENGDVLVKAARPIAIGLSATNGDPIVGAGDLQGWTRVEITPEMVGKTVAVYTSIECKREKGGRTSTEQANWAELITRSGGIGIIANSLGVAKMMIGTFINNLKTR